MIRNLRAYTLYSVLNSANPLLFVTMLFYLAKDISYFQIGIINLLTYSFCLISEIPAGYLADRCGNKRILMIGMCIKVISLSLLLTNNILLFFVAAILTGIETAFSSGADEALLYNHFEYNKVTDKYKEYLGKLNSITYLSRYQRCFRLYF